MPRTSLATRLLDPLFYLVDFDFADEGVVFAQARPEHFTRSLRLNAGDFPLASLRWVPFERVYRHVAAVSGETSINYLFHLPFCGSSLLTRYLEGSTLMVRDPVSLEALYVKRARERFPRSVVRLRRAALALLSRRAGDRAIVVRTAGYYPEMIDQLVRPPTCRAGLFLYASPDHYFAQVLKSPVRRKQVRLLFSERRAYVASRAGERLELLSDADVVALSWMFAGEIVLRAASRRPHRLRTLDCAALFTSRASRARAVEQVGRSFGVEHLRLSAARVRAIESRHAKLGKRFDASQRSREARQAAIAHGAEIRSGRALLDRLDPQGKVLAGLRSLAL
jgi:hypothetical protein